MFVTQFYLKVKIIEEKFLFRLILKNADTNRFDAISSVLIIQL